MHKKNLKINFFPCRLKENRFLNIAHIYNRTKHLAIILSSNTKYLAIYAASLSYSENGLINLTTLSSDQECSQMSQVPEDMAVVSNVRKAWSF